MRHYLGLSAGKSADRAWIRFQVLSTVVPSLQVFFPGESLQIIVQLTIDQGLVESSKLFRVEFPTPPPSDDPYLYSRRFRVEDLDQLICHV